MMRLRQAHAVLTIAKAIEDAGINFEFHPFDYDQYGAVPTPDDYMCGFAEFNDPDFPDRNTRTYCADILPGPGPFDVTVRLVFGYPGDEDEAELLRGIVQVAQVDDSDEAFVSGYVERVVARVVREVRDYESTFEGAYRERVAQSGGAQ